MSFDTCKTVGLKSFKFCRPSLERVCEEINLGFYTDLRRARTLCLEVNGSNECENRASAQMPPAATRNKQQQQSQKRTCGHLRPRVFVVIIFVRVVLVVPLGPPVALYVGGLETPRPPAVQNAEDLMTRS